MTIRNIKHMPYPPGAMTYGTAMLFFVRDAAKKEAKLYIASKTNRSVRHVKGPFGIKDDRFISCQELTSPYRACSYWRENQFSMLDNNISDSGKNSYNDHFIFFCEHQARKWAGI